MTISLDNAVVYDIETFPNVFTLHAESLRGNFFSTWEISTYRDDRRELMEWFNWLHETQSAMIGFNSVHFDYSVIHALFNNPYISIEEIYAKAQQIITSNDRFNNTIWDRDRFAPQIDLFKINHFDNKAKTTSLKALQINMRADTVVDMPVAVGTYLTKEQIDNLLIPYNQHDVRQTKRFAEYCSQAIDFRLSLIDQLGIDVLNYNDTKIGAKILEQRIGDEICYDRSSGRKQPRQTIRYKIALADIIFPYIQFQQPEFRRVHDYLLSQVLTADEIDEFGQEKDKPVIKTKGVFKDLNATINDITFHFGTGGIHASVPAQRIISSPTRIIRDIDVASLYPNIAIVNRLAPAHLGEIFTQEYAKLPQERKEWQKKKGKKCVEANSIKLASNGTYGNSNNKFSIFYDPQYTLQTTVNGQLLLCMLAEWLMTVPNLQIIQVNTDGITYLIDVEYLEQAKQIEKRWQDFTLLVLEDAQYSRMWIRDVNNYIAESMDGSLKQKGAYWHPEAGAGYADSISQSQPPAWHKDLGNVVSIKAAVAAMTQGIDPETFIRLQSDPFDFMCRVKADRSSKLILGNRQVQNTTRYYVVKEGERMVKISPASGPLGAYKKANGISDNEYNRVMQETGGAWDARVCTKNQSKYEERETAIEAGWKIAECNDARNFRFDNVDYAWYVNEAKKLII